MHNFGNLSPKIGVKALPHRQMVRISELVVKLEVRDISTQNMEAILGEFFIPISLTSMHLLVPR